LDFRRITGKFRKFYLMHLQFINREYFNLNWKISFSQMRYYAAFDI